MIQERVIVGNHPEYWQRISPPRRLWWIVPDTERHHVPLTCQFRPESAGKFTAELQNYVFSFNRSDNEARDRMAFQGYRDTWNTRGKVRDNYNAITGEGDPLYLPTIEYNIGFAGNVVAGAPMMSDGTIGIPSGVAVLRLETISVNNPLPVGLSYSTHPWLIHHQIITIYDLRNPFPHMGGRDTAPYLPTFTPLLSKVPMFIEMSKLREVTTIPNPYNPAW